MGLEEYERGERREGWILGGVGGVDSYCPCKNIQLFAFFMTHIFDIKVSFEFILFANHILPVSQDALPFSFFNQK